MQYLSGVSVSMTSSRFTHVVACGKISFFLLTRQLFFLFAFSSLKTIFKCL